MWVGCLGLKINTCVSGGHCGIRSDGVRGEVGQAADWGWLFLDTLVFHIVLEGGLHILLNLLPCFIYLYI